MTKHKSKRRGKRPGQSGNRPSGRRGDPQPGSEQRSGESGEGGQRRFGPRKDHGAGSGPERGRFRPRGQDEHAGREFVARGKAAPHVAAWGEDTKRVVTKWLEDAKRIPPPPRIDLHADPLGSLDSWQRDAVDALLANQSVVVDAPTTAGKTRVVESFFAINIGKPTFRAAYTTPVKSLANDKLHEFREMFGRDNVGIATGDLKENLNAPIVVATLESYRNSLLGTEPDLGRNIVVFDEYHYVQDISRGSAWEEAIILTPPSCQLLLLSASVGNSQQFCDWLNKIRNQDCMHVRTEGRPVPLEDLVCYQDTWVRAELIPETMLKQVRLEGLRPPPGRIIAQRAVAAEQLGLTPCIVYAGRRKSCETLAESIAEASEPWPEETRRELSERLQLLHEEFRALAFLPARLRSMMISTGVAYHHSGLAPQARVAVERLVKEGRLRFCTATMGLSLGINFSVRSALIADLTRPDERGLVGYEPSEVLQMLGRAGRRGRDMVGFSLWLNVESYKKLGRAKRDRCDSRLKNDPTTFLGLVGRGFGLRGIERFYSKSFLRYNDSRVDLGIIHSGRVVKGVGVESLPCTSPASEFAHFLMEEEAKCPDCPLRKKCHSQLQQYARGSLAALHLHLHQLGALDREEKLTPYGGLARYFPQAGGLLVARMITDGRVHTGNMAACAELFAGLALARHKQPSVPESYRWPFDAEALEAELEEHYPSELFPELYDTGGPRRRGGGLREFNPAAGHIISLWLGGMEWPQLLREVTSEGFGAGDLTSLLLRVGTYLQSMSAVETPGVAGAARWLRGELMRDPISPDF